MVEGLHKWHAGCRVVVGRIERRRVVVIPVLSYLGCVWFMFNRYTN